MENEIFTEDSEPVPVIHEPVQRSAENLAIKYYPVDLPSKGKLGYIDTVWYRDILVRDEKILASSTGANYQMVLSNVLKSLLKDSEDYYKKLSLYDRDFLLLWIWANNYDKIKTFDVTCPVCRAKSKFDVDITELKVNEVDDDYTQPFELELKNGENIKLRLLNIGDEETSRSFIKKNLEYSDQEYHVMIVNAMQLPTILPLKEKLKWVESNVQGRDMSMIRAFHKHFKYGVDDVVDFSCPECSEVTPFPIPFSLEFFFPVMERDFEELLRFNKRTQNKSD